MRKILKTKKRKFIFLLLLVAIGAGIYFFYFKKDSNTTGVFGPGDPHANSLAAHALNCGLSVATDEGPYYVRGTDKLKGGNLNPDKFEGDKIQIVGYVYEGAGKDDKIANAKIEIWQPNSYGTFFPAAKGQASDFSKQQLAFRGYINSDRFGYYSFTSIYPGPSEGRARHIYLKASADGYKELTTQLVMSRSGDLVNVNDDPVASKLPNCNVMNFGAVEGVQTSAYDFHLEKAADGHQ